MTLKCLIKNYFVIDKMHADNAGLYVRIKQVSTLCYSCIITNGDVVN